MGINYKGSQGQTERAVALQEEDTIIVKWAQEDVETLYSLLNNNNSNYMYHYVNIKPHL